VRLTQVLLNLVGNAVKFTARGKVSLAVWVEDENARELRLAFTVTDTGIGIPEERRADLFDAFTQVDTSAPAATAAAAWDWPSARAWSR
jgi:signal transduction histidine kinase